MPPKPKKETPNAKTTGRTSAAVANGRIRRSNRGNDTEPCDYGACSPDRLQQAIASVTARGCAIQLGYTRDGGAYCIRIVGDGEPFNEYVRQTEDIDVYLAGLIEDYQP